MYYLSDSRDPKTEANFFYGPKVRGVSLTQYFWLRLDHKQYGEHRGVCLVALARLILEMEERFDCSPAGHTCRERNLLLYCSTVTIFHCEEDEKARRLVHDLHEKSRIRAQHINVNGLPDSCVLATRAVYWLLLISDKALRSHSTVVAIRRLLDQLSRTPAEKHRMLPLVLGGDAELRRLHAVLPEVARQTPLMIRKKEELCKLPEALLKKLRAEALEPVMKSVSFHGGLDSLWLDETKEVIVPVKEKELVKLRVMKVL